jgi:hypothetical protein
MKLDERQVASMRREAKQLKKRKPQLRHTQALDLVAASHGFKHWGEALRSYTGRVAMQPTAADLVAFQPVELIQ